MFTQSKQLVAAVIVGTAFTSIGLGLLVSSLTCDCAHSPDCTAASLPSSEPTQERYASAEPWGQLPPDVLVLEPKDQPPKSEREFRKSRRRPRSSGLIKDYSWGWDLMDVSDTDLKFEPEEDLLATKRHARARRLSRTVTPTYAKPRKVTPTRAKPRKVTPTHPKPRKQEIADPWKEPPFIRDPWAD